MPRRVVHPYGQSIPITRAFSLLFALAILGMLYERMRDPVMWRWLANEGFAADAAPNPVQQPAPQPPEKIVPGANDLDPNAVAEMNDLLSVVRDKEELLGQEMPAYWRLMKWARSQSFAAMEQRAIKDVPFVKLWEEPEKYRGKLVRMRMHARRNLEWEAPKNPLGLDKTYEVVAWTDQSMGFPYIVVLPENPPGLPVGADIYGDIVFVGYFLKIMKYEAAEKTRGAPVFIGRARFVEQPLANNVGAQSLDLFLAIFAVGGLMLGGMAWLLLSRRSRTTLGTPGLPSLNEGEPFWAQPANDSPNEEGAPNEFDFTGRNGT